MDNKQKKHVYIIGSKGIPAKYGGFETFVEKLTEYQIDDCIQYHVACMVENSEKSGIKEKEFLYNGAMCFNIEVPNIGPARAIYYDIKALDFAVSMAERNQDVEPVFYTLACRIGPFIGRAKKRIQQLNGKLYVNPDGHEWMRAKWSYLVRKYWKYSEKLMVKYADSLICDSKNIEKYIQEEYKLYSPKTTYIAYGTDLTPSKLNKNDGVVREWYKKYEVGENNYYLVVGRFVPENNYETIIKEFMKSNTSKDLVLITNIEKNKFYNKLKKLTQFDSDKRIKFVGTVYNQELLKYIRENAFAYIHGHEVGGTNPSLLEALASTKLNLLLDVGFNREVGGDEALYWRKDDLYQLINIQENPEKLNNIRSVTIKRLDQYFSWRKISENYESFLKK